ncbi:MAG: hypothetical protein AABZ60_24920 [Planctomycetota bacterium]
MSSEPKESQERTEALIQTLQSQKVFVCAQCKKIICFHEILFSIVMGYKNAPHCTFCLAQETEKTDIEFRKQIYRHIQQKSCWKMTWDWCTTQEGFASANLPSCLWTVP